MSMHTRKIFYFFRHAWKRLQKTDPHLLVGLLVVFFLGLLVVFTIPKFLYRSIAVEAGESAPQESQQSLFRHPLTGTLVQEPIADLPQVFGVMIDNHEDAWPASGIEKAFLVIEAPVEAGIPRLLAFFYSEQEIEKIGPVRSARPYFLDWNNEFDALYAHVGGSNAALDLIASGSTFDFNQYWWGNYFWRDYKRPAPHNVFTSTKFMNDFVEMRSLQGIAPKRLYDVWKFKDPELVAQTSNVHIDFFPPVYTVDWKYDPVIKRYVRFQSGDEHASASGVQIQADNVAVVITDIEILDAVGRRDVRTTGEGKAYLFQDGRVIEAVWKKPSVTERLKFYEKINGEEIIMNAGVTWIEVVGSEEDLLY